jgi:general secretion pathway protein C
MRTIPIPAIRSLSLPAWLASLALFALLCAISAYWAISLLAPRPPVAPGVGAADTGALPALQQAGVLFGSTRATLPAAAARNIQVHGIVAAGELGSAILAIDGMPARAYAVGETVGAGQQLAEVRTDAVVIASGTARAELPSPPTTSLAVLTSGPNQPPSTKSAPPPPLRALPPAGSAAAPQLRAPRAAPRQAPMAGGQAAGAQPPR